MHILVAFDRFQKPLKKHAKKLQKSSFERDQRGHEHEHNVATNMNETWPRTQRNMTTNVATNMAKRFIGHVVMWPGNSVTMWAMSRSCWTWPKPRQQTFFVEMKRDQKCAMNVTIGHVQLFSFLSYFLCFSADTSRKRCSQKCAFLEPRYHSRITFFIKFFQNTKRQNGSRKTCLGPQTG